MNKIFSLKAILATSIGAGIIGSLSLPAKAHANEEIAENKAELILSQNYGYGDRINNDESGDSLRNIVGLTGMAIGTGVVAYRLARAYNPSLVNSLPTTGNDRHTALLDRVKPKLRRELLRLVHNKDTASRLLSGTLSSHPNRNPNWLAEKVIYDLKRGR